MCTTVLENAYSCWINKPNSFHLHNLQGRTFLPIQACNQLQHVTSKHYSKSQQKLNLKRWQYKKNTATDVVWLENNQNISIEKNKFWNSKNIRVAMRCHLNSKSSSMQKCTSNLNQLKFPESAQEHAYSNVKAISEYQNA